MARCRVKTEMQELMSEPLALEVGMSCTDTWKDLRLSVISTFSINLSLSSLSVQSQLEVT